MSSPSADFVVLGKLVAPYGLRGAVKIFPFADDPQAWAKLPCWFLGAEGDDTALWRQTVVRRCRMQGEVLLAELECLADRDAAEGAKGLLVGVPRAAMPPTAEGEYYWADLIGLSVVNTRGEPLGEVLGLIETPVNPVLRVGVAEAKEERLLPFVAAVVLDVDLTARRIRVDWEADW